MARNAPTGPVPCPRRRSTGADRHGLVGGPDLQLLEERLAVAAGRAPHARAVLAVVVGADDVLHGLLPRRHVDLALPPRPVHVRAERAEELEPRDGRALVLDVDLQQRAVVRAELHGARGRGGLSRGSRRSRAAPRASGAAARHAVFLRRAAYGRRATRRGGAPLRPAPLRVHRCLLTLGAAT